MFKDTLQTGTRRLQWSTVIHLRLLKQSDLSIVNYRHKRRFGTDTPSVLIFLRGSGRASDVIRLPRGPVVSSRPPHTYRPPEGSPDSGPP